MVRNNKAHAETNTCKNNSLRKQTQSSLVGDDRNLVDRKNQEKSETLVNSKGKKS